MLLTVSAPHRGSSFADWWKLHIGRRLGAFQLATTLRLDINAVNDLTLDSCREFNEKTPDVPTVKYYSVAAASPGPGNGFRRLRFQLIASFRKTEGDNDGLVFSATRGMRKRRLACGRRITGTRSITGWCWN